MPDKAWQPEPRRLAPFFSRIAYRETPPTPAGWPIPARGNALGKKLVFARGEGYKLWAEI
jgi:hypothetical protein